MIIARTIAEVRQAFAEARSAGRRVGFVPTMGALHAGHLSLVAAAKAQCDFVVVSIFVNPAQFAPNEDLDAYPRPVEADLAACRSSGVDVAFVPSVEEMYGDDGLTTVTAAENLSQTLCGRSRPTHFAGVCTVVARLFNIVGPCRAFFGAKDYQQAVIIRRMVADRNFPVEVVTCPIVREPDGLAMSSRNAYLDETQRRQATSLHEALQTAAKQIGGGCHDAMKVIQGMWALLAAKAPAGRIVYIQIVDPDSLEDVETVEQVVVIALAVWFGKTRLIDNVLVEAAK